MEEEETAIFREITNRRNYTELIEYLRGRFEDWKEREVKIEQRERGGREVAGTENNDEKKKQRAPGTPSIPLKFSFLPKYIFKLWWWGGQMGRVGFGFKSDVHYVII